MPAPPRILLPKSVVFISTRIQEGLPITPTRYMKVILEGILGRAQKIYKVTVCHYIFMSNHLHILMLVENPDDVAAFMDRIKTESAHAINKLLGRVQRTVWCSGYDSPPVLTVEDLINKISYIYTNPQSANLVETIEQYPGLSSWDMFINKKKGFVAKWIQRPAFKKLKKTSLSEYEQNLIATELLESAKKKVVFRLSPNAWMKSFGIDQDTEIESINSKIIASVRQTETELQARRNTLKHTVIGAQRLKAQRMNIPFSPKKFGKRMFCICHDKELRIAFIDFVKELLSKAREIKSKWLNGDFSTHYPYGLFPPRIPRLGNSMPNVIRSLCY